MLLEEEAGASSVSSVFTLCNSAIGAGVLSLPYAFRCAGGCSLLSAVVVVVAPQSGLCLVPCALRLHRRNCMDCLDATW